VLKLESPPIGFDLDRLIRRWSPIRSAVHCSNCRHCLVLPSGGEIPIVVCERGHGKAKYLPALIRSGGRGWVPAGKCPDFESMG
jgi:hypothetical protein